MGVLKRILPFEKWLKIQLYKDKLQGKEPDPRGAYFIINKPKEKIKYCIARFERETVLLMAAGVQYVFVAEWIREQGLIPLIDHECRYLFEQGRLGEDNDWELCFEQEKPLKEVLETENAIVLPVGSRFYSEKLCLEVNGNKEDRWIHAPSVNTSEDEWRSYFKKLNFSIKESWKVKPEIQQRVEKQIAEWRKEIDGPLLAVFMREHFSKDFVQYYKDEDDKKIYAGHPMAPGVLECIEIVQEYCDKWGCRGIVVGTRYQDTLDLFANKFGEKIRYINRTRVSFSNTMNDRPKGQWQMTTEQWYKTRLETKKEEDNAIKEYLEEIITLSLCDFFLGARSSGEAAVMAFNGGDFKQIAMFPDYNESKFY